MSGLCTVRWVVDDKVVKDETAPYEGAVETVGDSGRRKTLTGEEQFSVDFIFDPPLVPMTEVARLKRALENVGAWKEFYTDNAIAWEAKHGDRLTISRYVAETLLGRA